MIAPLLLGAEGLAGLLAGKADHVRMNRMNDHYANWVYRKYGLTDKQSDDYFAGVKDAPSAEFHRQGITCR